MAKPFPRKKLQIWAADSLTKLFRATPRPPRAPRMLQIEAARGEVVSGQIALRPEGTSCGLDYVTVSPLTLTGSEVAIPVECRWVGHTYVPKAAGGVDPERLEGEAPGLYPDPLYPVYATQTQPHHYNPDHSVALCDGRTQGLWFTFRVPENTPPGEYTGEARFKVAYYGNVLTFPIRVKVYPAALPAEPTCGMENWFVLASLARQHQCEWFSERFWQLTENYFRNMVDHRQTHIVVPMFELIDFSAENGEVALGWEKFDRFVELALSTGFRTLIGNHLATYTYDDRKYQCGVHSYRVVDGEARYELHEGRTSRAAEWLAWFLPRLRAHLTEKGWIDRWWQHIRDEPHGIREDYDAVQAAVAKYAPDFRTMDALGGPIVSKCDCWIPQLDSWAEHYGFFKERQQAGDDIWTYVCCCPGKGFANRFIDQYSVLPRLIFWIMARYGATGFLHWGFNWADVQAPEIDTTVFFPAQGPIQSGDVCVVYPGPNGPHDSIRWEQQREGIQDFELLALLAKRDPAQAASLCKRLIKGFDKYDTKISSFRSARRALLEALSG